MSGKINLAEHLMRSDSAARADCTILKAWCAGGMSTAQAIRVFKKNNGIAFDVEEDEFIKYVAGLGYRRMPNIG